ncbi:T9SS type A sorting domain-containing protein [candidate division TA06 bacterium]|nr:T9SS type A sorting domain-containing protein [candidate division TA06 bacterium]
MKRYILLCLLIVISASVGFSQATRKQFAYEQREGDTRPKPNLTPTSPSLVGKGELKVVRSKTPGWQPNGICICDTAWGAAPSLIVSDGKHGAIVCWTEVLRGYPPDTTHKTEDIYAQRVDSGGNEIWPHQGVPVCSLINAYSYYPAMISDGQGGAIIAWEDSRGGLGYTRVFAQRLDSLGNRLWPENGVLVCNQMSGYVDLCSDGHGGAIIIYADGRNEAITSDDIYAQRIDSAGNAVWQIDGVPVCTADSIQFWSAIVNDNNSGAIVTWQDYRSGNYDIFAQLVDSIGNMKWVINGVAVHLPTSQHERYPKIVQNSKGGAIVSWIDYGNGKTYTQSVDSNGIRNWNNSGVNTLGTYGDLNAIIFGGGVSNSYAAQRVDSGGNVKWGGGILLHKDTTGGQCSATGDGSEGIIIIWDDYHSSINYANQYVQKVDSGGNIKWPDTGVAICTLQMAYETYPQITSDGLGGALCTWFGNPLHGANRIYAQRIYDDGTPGGVTGEPVVGTQCIVHSLKLWPNPFVAAITLNYSLPQKTRVNMRVYNVTGQLVRDLIEEEEKYGGNYKTIWDGRNNQGQNLPSGLYFACLSVNGKTETKKLVKIK